MNYLSKNHRRRLARFSTILISVILGFILITPLPTTAVTIEEFEIPITGQSYFNPLGPFNTTAPWGITVGPDNKIWFTQACGNKIGRITLDGQEIKEFSEGLSPYSCDTHGIGKGLHGITTDTHGNIWFAQSLHNMIGRLNPAASDGDIVEFRVHSCPEYNGLGPHGITADEYGNIWFAHLGCNYIGRIALDSTGNPTHPVTCAGEPGVTCWNDKYDIPTACSGTASIRADKNDKIWFTEHGRGTSCIDPATGMPYLVNKVGRITLDSTGNPTTDPSTGAVIIEEISLPGTESLRPGGIKSGPDGYIWFSELYANKIVRMNPDSTPDSIDIMEYPREGTDQPLDNPRALTFDSHGNVWFTEGGEDRPKMISMIPVTNSPIIKYPIPSNNLGWQITTGPDGNIWFTEHLGNKIGKVTITHELLYGVTFHEELIVINPYTGSGTLIGYLDSNMNAIGLAKSDGRFYTFDQEADVIRELNIATGHTIDNIDIGLGEFVGEGAIAIRSDGVGFIMGAYGWQGSEGRHLWSFDVTVPSSTYIVTDNIIGIEGLDFDSEDTLYALSQSIQEIGEVEKVKLYTIDQLTGATTLVGSTGIIQNISLGGLAFGVDNTLYAVLDGVLYTLNKTTGAATFIGDTGFSLVSGLTAYPEDNDADGIYDYREAEFGNGGIIIQNPTSSPPDTAFLIGTASDGSTIITGDVEVDFPPGTTTSAGITIDFNEDEAPQSVGPSVTISGASLPESSTKSITMPFSDSNGQAMNAVCIDDTSDATVEAMVGSSCSGQRVFMYIPIGDGGLNTSGPYSVYRSGYSITVSGLSNTAVAALLGVSVNIDIKPDSEPNCFNQNEHGVIPAAILGSADVNVNDIDVDSLSLQGLAVKMVGKSNNLLTHLEDLNSDGYDDLVVQFEDSDSWVSSGSDNATITGRLYDGTFIAGTDSICIVP